MHDDLLFKTYSILWSFLNATLYCNFKISVKCMGILKVLLVFFFHNYFSISLKKKKDTEIKYVVMYYENIFKEKRNADYNVYIFSLFSTKFATHEPPPPPTPTPSKTIYYVCVVHFSQKQSILHVYVCFAFQSQEQSSPALTQCVRKDLAMAVRDLMQHGLMEVRFISTPHTPPTPTPTPHPHTCLSHACLSLCYQY